MPPTRHPRRTPTSPTTPGSSSPPARPARRRASRSATAARPPSSTPRRGCSCRTGRSAPATGCMAGPVGRLRRHLRGDVARLALRRLPGPGPALAGQVGHGPRARGCVANDITVVSTVPTLVALWPADGPRRRAAAHPRRRGLPARDRRPPRHRRAARSGTPTAPPRPPSSRAAPGSTGEPPVRIGLPLDGWDLAVVDPQGHRVPDGEPGELVIGGVGLARYLDPAKDAEMYAADADPGLGPRLPQRRPRALRRRRAWSSWAGPTTRSRSAVAASSSARSTARCSACPA